MAPVCVVAVQNVSQILPEKIREHKKILPEKFFRQDLLFFVNLLAIRFIFRREPAVAF